VEHLPVAFGFRAGFVHADDGTRRLSFADWKDGWGEHYFIIDRSEDSLDQAVPDMKNVYIERDDQGWGGYGGITRVVLERDGLTVRLGRRMATRMGKHRLIRITFDIKAADFRAVRRVLQLIMRGYEDRLECRA
jgi:hypothetical protein